MNDHDKKLDEMEPKERMLHVVAGAIAVYTEFRANLDVMEQVIPERKLQSANISVPVGVIKAMTAVMGEMIAIIDTHKLVDINEVKAYMDRKAEEAGDDDEVCPSCGVVHDKENPLNDIVSALMAAVDAHAAIVTARGTRDGDDPPPKSKMH